MSEQIPKLSQDEIDHNIATRVLSDAQLLGEGAVYRYGVSTPSDEQISKIHSTYTTPEHLQESQRYDSRPMAVDQDLREVGSLSEQINNWIDHANIYAQTWLNLSKSPVPKENRNPGGGNTGFMWLRNENLTPQNVRNADYRTHPGFHKQFADAGVSELVTVQVLDEGVESSVEELIMISYETMHTGNSTKYEFNRPTRGNFLAMNIVLPASQATELIGSIERRPETIRELSDAVMSENFGIGENWTKVRPPYEKWNEINGGVDRIALRDGAQTHVQDSKLLEF